MTIIYHLSKTHQNEHLEIASIFHPSKIHPKIHRNDVEFFPVKITSKKVHRNDVDFLPIEFTSNNACQNKVEFSPIKAEWKKLFETMWKFVDVLFLTYRRNVNIEQTSIWCVVSVWNSTIHSSSSKEPKILSNLLFKIPKK